MPALYRAADALVFPSRQGRLRPRRAGSDGERRAGGDIAHRARSPNISARTMCCGAIRTIRRRSPAPCGRARCARRERLDRARVCGRGAARLARQPRKPHLPVYDSAEGGGPCLRCAFAFAGPTARAETCYSPSLVIKDYFAVGAELSAGGLSRAQPRRAHHRQRAGAGEVRLSPAAAPWPSSPASRPPRQHFGDPDARVDRRRIRRVYEEHNHGSPLPSRAIRWPLSAAARPACRSAGISSEQRHRSCGVGEAARRPCLAGRALGHVLPGDAELAMPAAGLSLSRPGPARLHAAR